MFKRKKSNGSDPFGDSTPVPTALPALPRRGNCEVVILAAGDKKIQVIKVVRAATGLGLKEAKALVDVTPSSLGFFQSGDAELLRAHLVEAGGTAAVNRPSGDTQPEFLAAIGQLVVQSDCLYTPEGDRHLLSAQSTASVDATGSVQVTRGRDLAAKAVGGLLMPGGVFLFGNAREQVHDVRELYISIEDPTWHYVVAVHPDLGREARDIAAAVRRAAAALSPIPAGSTGDAAALDPVELLERLVALRDRGVLTEEEFAGEKARILGQ